VAPWDLLVRLDILSKSLGEWKLFTSFFSVVVGLLNIIKLEVFIPVAHSGFVGIFRASL
jgi:hypothetical protein